jgi:hypothetical protein
VVEETIRATVIKPNQAIRLRARKECIDREGVARVTGEEWITKKTGAYLPGAYEEVVDIVNAYVLTDKVRLLFSLLFCLYVFVWLLFCVCECVCVCACVCVCVRARACQCQSLY